MRTAGRTSHRGLSLLEVVLAMGLLVALSGLTYWFYSSSLASRDGGLRAVGQIHLARTIVDRMATEIRQIAAESQFRDVSVRGEPDRIWITSYRTPGLEMGRWRAGATAVQEPLGEFDIHKVEYKIARHPGVIHQDGFEMPLGLARVELRVPRKDSAETGAAFEDDQSQRGETIEVTTGGRSDGLGGFGDLTGGGEGEAEGAEEGEAGDAVDGELNDPEMDTADEDGIQWEELYAPEIRYLRFCYYDGKKWWDDWDIGGEAALPQLIQITVGFEPWAPFGEDSGVDELKKQVVDRACECMNEDPSDCERQPADHYTVVVRIHQADMFFRSRITKESQAVVKELTGE
jgi:hypothetical protein